MRAAIAVVALAACGGGDKTVANASGDAPVVAPIERLDLPRMDRSDHVLLLAKAKPSALVWVDTSGRIAVGKTGPAWNGKLTPPLLRDVEPALVRIRVLEAIRDGGGPSARIANAELVLLHELGTPVQVPSDRGRLPAQLPGASFAELGTLDRLSPLVIATPSAPSTVIADVLSATGGALAVDHLGQLAALDVAFDRDRHGRSDNTASWIEVSVDSTGVHVTKMPVEEDSVAPWIGASIDHAAVADRLRKLDDGAKLAVDIVVRPDTTAQTLVDLLVALADHGIHAGLVKGPGTTAERHDMLSRMQRGLPPVADISPGQPAAQGDLDKSVIRDTVRTQMPAIKQCYDQALAGNASLEGTVTARFSIAPTGKVAESTASGVDPDLAKCVADTIRELEFPQPKGGGSVQVLYPFTFRGSP